MTIEISNVNFKDILEKMNSSDNDVRFMAANDLLSFLSNKATPSPRFEPGEDNKLIDALLRLLSDPFGDIQNVAVRCLGPLAAKSKPCAERIVSIMYDAAFKQDDEKPRCLRDDVICMVLRSVIQNTDGTLSFCPDGTKAVQVCQAILSELSACPDSGEVLLDLLASGAGPSLLAINQQISKEVVDQLLRSASPLPVNKTVYYVPASRLCLVLARVAKLSSQQSEKYLQSILNIDSDFTKSYNHDLITYLLTRKFDAGDRPCIKMRALVAILKAISIRELESVASDVIDCIDYQKCKVKLIRSLNSDDLIESDFVDMESVLGIYACLIPVVDHVRAVAVMDVCKELMFFDPTYRDNEDDLGDYGEENEAGDDFSDDGDDDVSWRVRRASILYMVEFIHHSKETYNLENLCSLLVMRLAVERAKSVRLEIVKLISLLNPENYTDNTIKVLCRTICNRRELIASRKLALKALCRARSPQTLVLFVELMAKHFENESLDMINVAIESLLDLLTNIDQSKVPDSINCSICRICLSILERPFKNANKSNWKTLIMNTVRLLRDSVSCCRDEELLIRLFNTLECPVFKQDDEIAAFTINCAYVNIFSKIIKRFENDIDRISENLIEQAKCSNTNAKLDCIFDALVIVLRCSGKATQYQDKLLPILLNTLADKTQVNTMSAALGVVQIIASGLNDSSEFARPIIESIVSITRAIIRLPHEEHYAWESVIADCLRIMQLMPNDQFIPVLEELFYRGWSRLHKQTISSSNLATDGFVIYKALQAYLSIVKRDLSGENLAITIRHLCRNAHGNSVHNSMEVFWARLIACVLLIEPAVTGKPYQQDSLSELVKENIGQFINCVENKRDSYEMVALAASVLCEMGRICDIDALINDRCIRKTSADIALLLDEKLGMQVASSLGVADLAKTVKRRSQRISETGSWLTSKPSLLLKFVHSCISGLEENSIINNEHDEEALQALWKLCTTGMPISNSIHQYANCLSHMILLDTEHLFADLCKLHSEASLLAIRNVSMLSSFPVEPIKQYVETELCSIIENNNSLRKSAIITLDFIMHNRPIHVVSTGQTLETLLQQTKVKAELIKSVEIGPFRHKVDDGLEVRKAAFDCVNTLVNQKYRNKCTWVQLFECDKRCQMLTECILKGLEDDAFEIKVISHITLLVMLKQGDRVLEPTLDRIEQIIIKHYDKSQQQLAKYKEGDVPLRQENDRNKEICRYIVLEIFWILKQYPGGSWIHSLRQWINTAQIKDKLIKIEKANNSHQQKS